MDSVFWPWTSQQTRTSPGKLVDIETLEVAVVLVLESLGGSAPSRLVVQIVGWLLEHDWTGADLEKVDGGRIRWERRVGSLRTSLCKKGILEWNAPHGIWRLR